MSQCPPPPKKQRLENSGNGDLQPKKLNFKPLPLTQGFPNEHAGETRMNHADKNGHIGTRDFERAITPD